MGEQKIALEMPLKVSPALCPHRLPLGLGHPVEAQHAVKREHHPPPGRHAEEVEQHLGHPGAGRARLVRDRLAGAAEEGAGVAAVVGGQRQREVEGYGEEEEPARLAQQLLTAGLAVSDSPRAGKQLFERRGKRQRKEWLQKFTNILYIKIPIFDPERVLTRMLRYVGWIFSLWFFALSVAFMVAVNLELMRDVGPVGSVLTTGGLAQNDYLCQAIADVARLPVRRLALREGTARGAAFLAAGDAARWAEPPLDRSFAPGASDALVTRFGDWRREMARRGASGPASGAA